MCDAPDWEPTICRSVERKAQKAHTCRECGQVIPPRAKYYRCSSLTDGSWSGWNQCARCERLERAHSTAEYSMGGSGGYVVGGLRQQIAECIREEPRYLGAFRAAWKAARAAWSA